MEDEYIEWAEHEENISIIQVFDNDDYLFCQ